MFSVKLRKIAVALVLALAVTAAAPAMIAADEDVGEAEDTQMVEPDSPLYIVQQVIERAQMDVMRNPQERAQFSANMIERRAEEAERVAGRRDDLLRFIADRMQEHMAEAERSMAEGEQREEDLTEAAEAVGTAGARAKAVLTDLIDSEEMPAQAKEALELAKDAVENGEERAADVLASIAAGELPGNAEQARESLGRVQNIPEDVQERIDERGPGSGRSQREDAEESEDDSYNDNAVGE